LPEGEGGVKRASSRARELPARLEAEGSFGLFGAGGKADAEREGLALGRQLGKADPEGEEEPASGVEPCVGQARGRPTTFNCGSRAKARNRQPLQVPDSDRAYRGVTRQLSGNLR
jgi:hypothetical protein